MDLSSLQQRSSLSGGSQSLSMHSNSAKVDDAHMDRARGFPSGSAVNGGAGPAEGRRSLDADFVAELLDRVKNPENRRMLHEIIERDQRNDGEFGSRTDARTDITEESGDMSNGLHLGKSKIVPKVRRCTFAQFKNRFSEDEDICAVDALESGRFLEQETQEEVKLRDVLPNSQPSKKERHAKTKKKQVPNLVDKAIHTDKSDTKWISRVRIQSPALLAILAGAMQESWSVRPRTFFRPFEPLFYFHDEVRQALNRLEDKWGDHTVHHTVDNEGRTPLSGRGASEEPGDWSAERIDDSPMALADLRAYVNFVEQDLMRDYKYYNDKAWNDKSEETVRFQDLWYLFNNGEYMYRPVGPSEDKENTPSGQRMWRPYGKRLPFHKYRATSTERQKYMEEDYDGNEGAFGVDCYFIDFTGEEFCHVTDTFYIQPFDGDRPISTLPVFPLRFLPNYEKVFETSASNGKNWLHFIETKHAHYNWRSLTTDPAGNTTTDADEVPLKRPEHINSAVIVDFVEAFLTGPIWKPTTTALRRQEPDVATTADPFYVNWWSDSKRTKLLAEMPEILVLKSGVPEFDRNQVIFRNDPFLVRARENEKNKIPTDRSCLQEADYPLLPVRVFAYVLQDRKFVQLDSRKLMEAKSSLNAFDSLKINPHYKSMIDNLVRAHFLRKSSEKHHGAEPITQDLILGKGKGLFILLHGVPGVGKTATAEAMAQASGKPLFPITCGDLGLTPNEVEAALQKIFRLAHTWDCVLLLDEVDTFFSQRARGDTSLAKNALVSVFLRVLEYYNGLLFLTTNRPGALDEAFKSRIHLKLYYPPLDSNQTRDIWEMNIERLRMIEMQRCQGTEEQPMEIFDEEVMQFASKQYTHSEKHRWNGRQIRNAFQIASSLAYYDAQHTYERLRESHQDTLPLRPKLDVAHFEMLGRITDGFEQYMEEAVGKTAAQMAHDRMDRADHWTGPAGGNDSYFTYGSQTQPEPYHSRGGWEQRPDPRQQQPQQPQRNPAHFGSFGAGEGYDNGGPSHARSPNPQRPQLAFGHPYPTQPQPGFSFGREQAPPKRGFGGYGEPNELGITGGPPKRRMLEHPRQHSPSSPY